jgi:hypothetical protein
LLTTALSLGQKLLPQISDLKTCASASGFNDFKLEKFSKYRNTEGAI